MKRLAQLLNGYLPGRLAANPWVLLGLTPFIVFFATEAYFPEANDDLAFVITVIVLAHLATSVTVVLLNFLVIRFFMIRSVTLLLLTYLLAGVMDSVVLIAGLDIPWIPPGSGLSAWAILSFGSLVTSAWLLMGHLALGLLIGNVRAYGQLQAWNSELLLLNESTQAELRSYRDSLQGAIAERIERVLGLISAQLEGLSGSTNPKLLLSTAANVRELAENDVRRLSHELSEAGAEDYLAPKIRRRFSWSGFVKFGGDASANIPWVLSVGTLQAISLALAIGSAETTLVVLVSLLVGFPVLVWVDKARQYLIRNAPIWLQILSAPIEYLVMALIGVQVVSLLAADIGDLHLHIDTFRTSVPIGAISIWFLIFVIRGFSSTYDLRTKQLAAVSTELLDSLVKVRAELAGVRNRLARILHGSVQGRLASVSLALTATASASSTAEANDMIAKAKTQLELAKSDLLESFSELPAPVNFESQLDALLNGWRGLIEIEMHLDDSVRAELVSRDALGTKVVEAMQECLTNAVRHGSAKSIRFVFTVSGSALFLTATNAGGQLPVDFKPGLGWRQMEAGADSIEMQNNSGNFELRLSWLL